MEIHFSKLSGVWQLKPSSLLRFHLVIYRISEKGGKAGNHTHYTWLSEGPSPMATHKTSQLPTTRKVSKSGYSKVHLPPPLNIFETGILKPIHLFPWQHFFVDNTAKLTMPSTIAGFLDTTNDVYCASLLCMATTRQGSAQNNRKALPRQAPW